MTKRQVPVEAIGDLPEWRDARWTVLHGGLTNRTWRLQKDGRQAVIKVDDQPRSAPYNSRAAEAAVQSDAARAGLANAVLFADSRVYLTDYIDGSVWDRDFFDDERNVEQLALALKRLHALPLSGRRFDAVGAAKIYTEKIATPQQSLVDLCLSVIEATPLPDELCLCHNDLVADNIISTPAIRFLDWEYASDNEPMFDLATVIEHHQLGATQVERLLDVYMQGRAVPWHTRLVAQRRLYLALWWLWLAAASSDAADDAGALEEIGGRLVTSCS